MRSKILLTRGDLLRAKRVVKLLKMLEENMYPVEDYDNPSPEDEKHLISKERKNSLFSSILSMEKIIRNVEKRIL